MAKLFGWALVLTGPTIFLHEAGHYLAGLGFGEEVWMTAASVESNTPASEYPPLQRAIQTGMGPVVSIILTLIGLALIKRSPGFGAALAVTAPARFIFSVGFLGVLAYRAIKGLPAPSPSFDEYTVASAFDMPVWPLLVAELLFLIFVAAKVHRALPQRKKWIAWLALVIGTIVGGYLWLAMLGPALLS
ncbi:hypothetical protein [Aurantiacibacter sp. MUD61]|uniref:hypothetical protein n=1 Tax=Aurantiacibacter sp. MUD61 TaxID=3009083 RepID=UPI0022F0768C|nr:hypothetical protein [Aurantiacibacter sp. MUD61]